MTQEEKARAYDKALNIAREILDHTSENYLCTHLTKEDIKDMYIRFFFPELKESEDERIRKGLIKAVSRIFEGNKLFDTDVTREEALAWLEKVITPNHNDIDSSFIEDIKNVINEAPLLMQSDKEKMIAWLEKQGESYTKRDVDDAWLKGMCDAKRELEKQGEQDMIPLNKVIKFLDEQLVNDKDEVTGEPFINFQNYGAYKETFISYFKRKMLKKQDEQKTAEKIEPFDKYEGLTDFERTLADICIGWIGEEFGWKQYIKDNADVLLKIAVEKFNSVQDVPFEQNPATSYCQEHCKGYQETGKCFADGDCKDKRKAEQKSAWSEEDEEMCQETIDWFEKKCFPYALESENPARESIKWLKSLEDRYTWKPSDEQIEALDSATENCAYSEYQDCLRELIGQLKKLREE